MAFWQHYVTATATCLMLNLSTGAVAAENDEAQSHCRHGHKSGHFLKHNRPERMLEHMTRELDLTEEQEALMRAEFESRRQTRQLIHDELRELRQQLQQAAVAGASETEIESLASQVGDLAAKGAVERVKAMRSIKQVLTAEQVEKMDTMINSRTEHYHHSFF